MALTLFYEQLSPPAGFSGTNLPEATKRVMVQTSNNFQAGPHGISRVCLALRVESYGMFTMRRRFDLKPK